MEREKTPRFLNLHFLTSETHIRFVMLMIATITLIYTFTAPVIALLIEPLPDTVLLGELQKNMESFRQSHILSDSPASAWLPFADTASRSISTLSPLACCGFFCCC